MASTASDPDPPTDGATTERPLVSMLLIGYRQEATIAEAIAGALAQTYSPLEVLVSDDASDDGTWAAMQAAVAGYTGPHRVVLNRNPRNLGIGAHLSLLAARAQGELLFVAAGDDVSLPERCTHCVAAWFAANRRPDLIACPLIDIDAAGQPQGLLRPSQLADWRSAADWVRQPPHVIGAGQAWTRRLVERFGPLPKGTVAEDLVMVFRAIVAGGAVTLDEPLVRYRRGGLSRRRRVLQASEVAQRLASNARHSVIELEQVLADARCAGVEAAVAGPVGAKLARERHIAAQFAQGTPAARLRRLFTDGAVPWPVRLRTYVYAAMPGLTAPWFALKRWHAARHPR